MSTKSNLKPEKPSLVNSQENGEHLENLSDSERRAKYGNYGSRKTMQSKREMMEELSHERFPWEE